MTNQFLQAVITLFSYCVWKFLFFWSTYLLLIQPSRGWTFREMCSVVVWQVRPRRVEEEVCSEEKAYLSQSSISDGLGGTCLQLGVHVQPAFVFLGNPAGLEVRDECFRLWGWLAWKVAITEVFLWVLGHSAAHLWATVSCPHSGAGWGLSQAPRLRLPTIRAAFSWHAAITRLRSSFSWLCPRGGPFRKLSRHAHREMERVALPWPGIQWDKRFLSSELSLQYLSLVVNHLRKEILFPNKCIHSQQAMLLSQFALPNTYHLHSVI